MARIPDGELERLKADVSVLRLVEAAGIELKCHGKDWLGCCPFHDDKTPSLVVSPEKNLWHCLGACNIGGTAIDWVMRMQGVSFRLAVELLREGLPTLAAPAAPGHTVAMPQPIKRNTTMKLPSDLKADADDQACLQRVVAYYHATLKQSPEALEYLQCRGLNHPELLDTFKLGFANRTLAYRLPEKNRVEGEAIRTQLQRVGILRASGHEHFNGSIVIPLFDEHGHVVQIYGRKLLDNLRTGTPKHLYLPAPHRGIFNATALSAAKEIILCEALIDALTFWCAGYRNVTTSYGVNGFTDEHLAFFRNWAQCGAQHRVFIAYDRDEAGDSAAEVLAKKLIGEGIECLRVQFPHGFDANSYALKVQPAEKSLGVALRGAQWMGKGAVLRTAQAVQEPAAVLPAPVIAEPIATPLPTLAAESSLETTASIAALPSTDIPIEVRENEILILFGDRRWRIRGLATEPTPGQLKINLLVSREGCAPQGAFHVDTLDLYAARLRAAYLKQAAVELQCTEDTLKRDLGVVLLKLEALQAEQANTKPATPALTMTADEKAAAMTLLRDPQLIERIVNDLSACGIVGEDSNKLVAYLACLSRKQEKPLAIVIQSTSAAGKSTLMDAVLSLMPSEDRVHYSAMTGQSLFYMGEIGVKHKILAIAEERGVQEASYALKLLQSQGELTIASTGKDPVTGRLVTHEYKVEGPVMLFLTTTAIEVDEELLNRCLVLTVNESREQTRAIHALQRKRRTLAGLLEKSQRDVLVKVHQNAQRLLRTLPVVNPYAEQLSFIDATARTRRDHEKYLSLIESITLLRQYQREIKTTEGTGGLIEYVEVTLDDIALANELAHQVLGHSLDELPPQTRRLLKLVVQMVAAQCTTKNIKPSDYRFSRRDVRECSGFGHTQLRLHLDRLVDMEYLLVHRGTRGASFVYELLYDGEGIEGVPFMPGLLDVETLRSTVTTSSWRGSGPQLAGRVRGQSGGVAGPPPHTVNTIKQGTSVQDGKKTEKRTSVAPAASNGKSHRSHAALSSTLAAS
jgi:DNA primase